LCQMDSVPGNKEKNLNKMKKMIERNPGDIHIFPELNISGYLLKDQVVKVAEAVDGPSLRKVMALAKKHSSYIVCGMPIREEDTNVRNAALLITPEMEVFPYFKTYIPNFLPFEEMFYFKPHAERQEVIQTEFGKVGLLVCYDIFFPEVCLNYAKRGVNFLFCISASPSLSRPLFETLIPARAVESTAFFAYVNAVGSEERLTFWGGSEVRGPRGNRMAKAPYFEEVVTEVEVDLSELRVARAMRPVLRDRRVFREE
ncbi:MAG TPA: carbon-nitrogen hydrolase family protein, partial [Thermoplasmata archaeon]|nr:carbon-nitrogen hydrolase family protein [Thermoplasmata archaeon]